MTNGIIFVTVIFVTVIITSVYSAFKKHKED